MSTLNIYPSELALSTLNVVLNTSMSDLDEYIIWTATGLWTIVGYKG